MSRQQLLRTGTRFVAEHRVAGPVLLGLGAGVTILAPFGVGAAVKNAAVGALASLALVAAYVSSAGLGAMLGRGGLGRAGFLLAAAGMLGPVMLTIGATAQNPPDSGGCRSCVADGLFFGAPWIAAMLLAPMAIGYWRTRRSIAEGPVA